MDLKQTNLADLWVIAPQSYEDNRGSFAELFHADKYAAAGVVIPPFIQINESRSKQGVIRGMHFQWDKPLGKLIRITRGRAFVVAADIRKKSPTFGAWFGQNFDAAQGEVLWAPFGFATGFCALEDDTRVEYCYSAAYNKEGEGSIRFDDPTLAITWPITEPIVSERDRAALFLQDWATQDTAYDF